MTRLLAVLALAVAALFPMTSPSPAAAVAAPAPVAGAVALTALTVPAVRAKPLTAAQRGNIALDWAETQAGKPYEWGGTGPYGYDCSGLVMTAFEKAGVFLPRTTYEMLESDGLARVSRPVRGDLVFFGTGHVEIDTIWPYTTFGAHSAGQAIGWLFWGWGGHWPAGTMFFEVK